MNKLTVTLALVAGLLGGLLNRLITPQGTFAQNQAPVTREIRAQSFTLVDPMDRTVGTFTAEPVPLAGVPVASAYTMRVVLRDPSGNEIWSASGRTFRPLSHR